jgi:hypothetical protein
MAVEEIMLDVVQNLSCLKRSLFMSYYESHVFDLRSSMNFKTQTQKLGTLQSSRQINPILQKIRWIRP